MIQLVIYFSMLFSAPVYSFDGYSFYGSDVVYRGQGYFMEAQDSIYIVANNRVAPWKIDKKGDVDYTTVYDLSLKADGIFGEGKIVISKATIEYTYLFTFTEDIKVTQYAGKLIYYRR